MKIHLQPFSPKSHFNAFGKKNRIYGQIAFPFLSSMSLHDATDISQLTSSRPVGHRTQTMEGGGGEKKMEKIYAFFFFSSVGQAVFVFALRLRAGFCISTGLSSKPQRLGFGQHGVLLSTFFF